MSTENQPWPSVLIVDDEVGFRQLLGWRLGALGLYVVTVADGAAALEMLQTQNFHLVVTDLTMPRLQGLAVLENVKKNFPSTEVIVLTGFGTVETAVHAMKLGAFDFILKPFDLPTFIACALRALRKVDPTFQPLYPEPR